MKILSRWSLVWLLLLIPCMTPAQATDSIRACVTCLNARTERLWLLHKALEAGNQALNHYYTAYPADRPGRVEAERRQGALRLSVAPFREAEARAPRLCVAPLETGSFPSHKDLISLARQGEDLYRRMTGLAASLADYVDSGAYLDEPDLTSGYTMLRKFAVYLEDYAQLNRRLWHALQENQQRLAPAAMHDPLAQAGLVLGQVVQAGRQVVLSVKAGDIPAGMDALAVMEQDIRTAAARQADILAAAETRPGSTHDPAAICQALLRQAEALAALGQDWVTGKAPGTAGRGYPVAYAYYNTLLNNKFSRPGEGLVYRYNQLAAAAPALLPLLTEPAWLMVIGPSPRSASARVAGAGPRHIVLVLDVSGSMARRDKLPLAQEMLLQWIPDLQADDRVSLVTFAETPNVCTAGGTQADSLQLVTHLVTLTAGGGSQGEAALTTASELATRYYQPGGVNRIVLISDGGFEITPDLLMLTARAADRDILLYVLYTGRDLTHSRPHLTRLSSAGRGAFLHVQAGQALGCLQQATDGPYDLR